MKIPLAEHFHSIQGEGYWTGTPMHFIRLPGCNVGRKVQRITPDIPAQTVDGIPIGQVPLLTTSEPAWLCHRYDGRPFWCDTDFNKHGEEELDALMGETFEHHICLTGGEPFLHPEIITALEEQCKVKGKMLHIETSGTLFGIPLDPFTWITVCPKKGCKSLIPAQEVKLLVGPQGLGDLPPGIDQHQRVYLSPINNVGFGGRADIEKQSLQAALKVLKLHPEWRLSVQLHKYLGVR